MIIGNNFANINQNVGFSMNAEQFKALNPGALVKRPNLLGGLIPRRIEKFGGFVIDEISHDPKEIIYDTKRVWVGKPNQPYDVMKTDTFIKNYIVIND